MQTQLPRSPTATLVVVEVGPPPLQEPAAPRPAEPDFAPGVAPARPVAPVTPGYTRHALGVIEAERDRRLQQRGHRSRRRRTALARPHARLSAALEAERAGCA